ncbi:MAG: DUF1858 domain-containing protein [Desulfatirhabdiaceae bacterium]
MIKPDLQLTVRELLERHPSMIRFFIRHHMKCVGCPTEAFHTLEDVVRIHNIAPKALLDNLEALMKDDPKPGK